MSNERVAKDGFDPHIIPAETAARKDREGDNFKQIPDDVEGDIDTTGGFTVDSEGLVNNFAIEPEMYYEEPGDLKAKEEAEEAARAAELHDINDNDETGKLTMEKDERGKGAGVI